MQSETSLYEMDDYISKGGKEQIAFSFSFFTSKLL